MRSWVKQGVLLWSIASAGAAAGQAAPGQALAAAAVPAAAAAPAPIETKCGLLLDTPDGKGQFEEHQDIRPLTQTGPGKSFQTDAPLDAAVMCGRTSVLPMPYDVQVAMTGHSFYIIDKQSDRIGVLEINGGVSVYRMLKGVLSKDEEAMLQQRLEQMQTIAAGMAP